MSAYRALLVALLTTSAFVLASGASAMPKPEPEYPRQTQAKVPERPIRGFDATHFSADVDLAQFDSLLVLPPKIEFDARWLREHRTDMTRRDEERLQESYTELLQTALETRLAERTNLTPVGEAGPNTLIIDATLTRFRLNAPDLTGGPRTESFVDHVGSARLELVLLTGAEPSPIARISDFRQTRSFGSTGLKRTNRVVNLRDFRHLFERWATRLADYLAESGTS